MGKYLKLMLAATVIAFGSSFSNYGLAADLSEILKKGEVKIAVPEAFAPFGSVG